MPWNRQMQVVLPGVAHLNVASPLVVNHETSPLEGADNSAGFKDWQLAH
jgi:hypothetical protein